MFGPLRRLAWRLAPNDQPPATRFVVSGRDDYPRTTAFVGMAGSRRNRFGKSRDRSNRCLISRTAWGTLDGC